MQTHSGFTRIYTVYIWSVILFVGIYLDMSGPYPIWFLQGNWRLVNFYDESKSAARPYPVPIWHI